MANACQRCEYLVCEYNVDGTPNNPRGRQTHNAHKNQILLIEKRTEADENRRPSVAVTFILTVRVLELLLKVVNGRLRYGIDAELDRDLHHE